MKLTLSMIVKNEERFLRGCLESVKGLVDEIVIVDTGSTDSTKEIARSFGAKVYNFEWCDDFSAARNESLGNSTGDWILYLDADERIDKSYHAKIRKLISGGKADAFLLQLKSKIGTREDAQYHLVSYPRLFRKIKGVAFSGEVHEQITNSLTAVGARILQSDVIIDHLGYAQDDAVILEKARRNHRLLLSQLQKGKNHGYALYQLGQTEIILGEVEKGLSHLNEALQAGGFGKSVEASVYGIIAENKYKLGEYEEALAACTSSLEVAPQQTFSHLMRGEIYLKLSDYRKSVESFLEAVEKYRSLILRGKTAAAIEPMFDVHVIYSKVGKAAALGGDVPTASLYLKMAAEEGARPQKIGEYIEFLVRNRMYREALEAADRFRQFEGEGWYVRLVSSALIDTEKYGEAAKLLEKAPEHDKVTLSSLANCRMKIGDFAGADAAFRQAVELGYDDPQGIEMYGLVQFKLGKFSDAASTLTRAAEINPANSRAIKFAQAARAQISTVSK